MKNLVHAGRLKDSAGNYIQRPVFKQSQNIIEPDSIIFHTKSKRAKVWNSRTKQGELFIKAEISKRKRFRLLYEECSHDHFKKY